MAQSTQTNTRKHTELSPELRSMKREIKCKYIVTRKILSSAQNTGIWLLTGSGPWFHLAWQRFSRASGIVISRSYMEISGTP